MILSIYAQLSYAYPARDLFGPSPRFSIYKSLVLNIDLKDLSVFARDNWLPTAWAGDTEDDLLQAYLNNDLHHLPREYWTLDESLAKEALERYDIDSIWAKALAERELPANNIWIMGPYTWRYNKSLEPIAKDKEDLLKNLMLFIQKT